jgi:hypothetical protein
MQKLSRPVELGWGNRSNSRLFQTKKLLGALSIASVLSPPAFGGVLTFPLATSTLAMPSCELMVYKVCWEHVLARLVWGVLGRAGASDFARATEQTRHHLFLRACFLDLVDFEHLRPATKVLSNGKLVDRMWVGRGGSSGHGVPTIPVKHGRERRRRVAPIICGSVVHWRLVEGRRSGKDQIIRIIVLDVTVVVVGSIITLGLGSAPESRVTTRCLHFVRKLLTWSQLSSINWGCTYISHEISRR